MPQEDLRSSAAAQALLSHYAARTSVEFDASSLLPLPPGRLRADGGVADIWGRGDDAISISQQDLIAEENHNLEGNVQDGPIDAQAAATQMKNAALSRLLAMLFEWAAPGGSDNGGGGGLDRGGRRDVVLVSGGHLCGVESLLTRRSHAYPPMATSCDAGQQQSRGDIVGGQAGIKKAENDTPNISGPSAFSPEAVSSQSLWLEAIHCGGV